MSSGPWAHLSVLQSGRIVIKHREPYIFEKELASALRNDA